MLSPESHRPTGDRTFMMGTSGVKSLIDNHKVLLDCKKVIILNPAQYEAMRVEETNALEF